MTEQVSIATPRPVAGSATAAPASERRASDVQRRSLASLAAFLAALLLVSLVYLVADSNSDRDAAISRQRQSYEVLIALRGLDGAMARSEAALGRFAISGDAAAGALYYDQWRLAGLHLRALAALTGANPTQRPLVRDMADLYARRGRELAAPAKSAAARGGFTALSLFDRAGQSPTIPRIATVLDRMSANERGEMGRLSVVADRSVARSNQLAALLSVIGLLLVIGGIVLGWLAVRAVQARREAGQRADHEADRAESLEQAVDQRTRELSLANAALREEAATREIAEAQLRQVQKMEAIGQLTGGIAHDFNNMLAVICGGLELAQRRLAADGGGPGCHPDVGRHLDNALDGANRAAALTKRLLAFARAEPLLPEGVDAGRLIAGMSDLIVRTLGERIDVTTTIAADGWVVWCDPNQLENAILNLAVNARDAMPDGGPLAIRTGNATIARGEVGEAAAGEYLCIDVTDHGTGMSREVLDRVFEPFFTTKPVGKGTGLGLSQIFGFARQSGGEIAIRSVEGSGTCVSLYLPRHVAVADGDAPVSQAASPAAGQMPGGGGRVVMVVEDDARVRASTTDALDELGYNAVACASGDEALAMLDRLDDVALILSDVVMPGMTGPELIDRVRATRPGIATMFVTGYVGDAGDAERFRGCEVLRKPFTIAALARVVGEAIDRAEPAVVDRAA